MGKVKVTKEQAEAIDYFKKTFVENRKTSMSNKKLIAALNSGYEVEPEFKVGDWVIFEYEDAVLVIGEITEIETEECTMAKVNNPKYLVPQKIAVSKLRYATLSEIAAEKERRLEAKLDELLLDLTDLERVRLRYKLNWGE